MSFASRTDRHVIAVGRSLTGHLEYTANVFLMVYLSIRETLRDHTQGARTILSVLASQIYFTGFQALPLISILALGSGALVILQSTMQLSLVGSTQMMGPLLVITVVREIGPLLTALVVIARSGTAVASEIGNMRANREIEALEVMGINPLSYIVFPRLVGGMISVFCLAIYFNMIALMGGFALAKFLPMNEMQSLSFSFYLDSLMNAFDQADLWLFLLKNIFSGTIIFIVCCYQGLSVKRSPTEVPIMTTQAVVKSVIYVVGFNLAVSGLFYLHQLGTL
jgi:phospholipid/cholesterol/gamma-HCH transport system permease protein